MVRGWWLSQGGVLALAAGCVVTLIALMRCVVICSRRPKNSPVERSLAAELAESTADARVKKRDQDFRAQEFHACEDLKKQHHCEEVFDCWFDGFQSTVQDELRRAAAGGGRSWSVVLVPYHLNADSFDRQARVVVVDPKLNPGRFKVMGQRGFAKRGYKPKLAVFGNHELTTRGKTLLAFMKTLGVAADIVLFDHLEYQNGPELMLQVRW